MTACDDSDITQAIGIKTTTFDGTQWRDESGAGNTCGKATGNKVGCVVSIDRRTACIVLKITIGKDSGQVVVKVRGACRAVGKATLDVAVEIVATVCLQIQRQTTIG